MRLQAAGHEMADHPGSPLPTQANPFGTLGSSPTAADILAAAQRSAHSYRATEMGEAKPDPTMRHFRDSKHCESVQFGRDL